uniref:Sushi domain-containing protein n=1 Tax=Canis lupus familiaris TaxID=9615 RepID=A0A8C0LV71_CANLF
AHCVVYRIQLCMFSSVGRTCDFPEIKHGRIYDEDKYKQNFPVAKGKHFYYFCDHSFASPSQSLWTQIITQGEPVSPSPSAYWQCFFPWVENGHSASSGQIHQEGDTIQIVCHTGYSLLHNQSAITCAEALDSAPKCGPPLLIAKGDITSFPLSVYALYVLWGNRNIVCSNGQWSESLKCLEGCVISEEIMEKHNIHLRWIHEKKFYSKTGDTIEFICKHGYCRKTSLQTFRVNSQERKLTYPISI